MEGFLDGLPTIAVNAGVFVGMVVVTILGGKFAMKAREPVSDPTKVIVGGMLQDNVTALMAAEANKVLSERVGSNTHVMERNNDRLAQVCHQLEILNRNIERLKDL